MKAANNTVVTFHYALSDEQGQPVESSRGGEPLAVLLGAHNIIPGLEKAIVGRASGESFQVTVPPAEAYGNTAPTSRSACRRNISAMPRS